MTHLIKLRIEFADAILDGDKNFEVRFNDRGYQKGDYIRFKTIDSVNLSAHHEVEKRCYQITYVLGGWGLKNGYVVFGFKEVDND